MIKFTEHTGELEELKTDVSDKYKNICPREELSDAEVEDFWEKEFAQERDKSELNFYEKLLSEIFGRSEDEISIDFHIDDNLQSVLQNFDADIWSELSEDDRFTEILNLAKEVGSRLGLNHIPGISVFEGEYEEYGDYNPENNVISLNGKHFNNPKELVNTLVHEMRHAFQNMRAEMFETWEDALYKCNFDNYISPMPLPGGGYLFFTDYQDQYVEADARAFANKFMEAMS